MSFAKLKQKSTSLMKKVGPELVKRQAERMFKDVLKDITAAQGLNALYFRQMAERGYSIEQVMEVAGKSFPEYQPNPGVDYLMSLTDEQFVELIREVAPEHAAILDQYPEFKASTVLGLKRLAGAAAR